MKITIDVIAEALNKYQPTVQLSTLNRQYPRLRFVQSEEWEPETLYIGYGKKIPSMSGIQNSGLIAIGKPLNGSLDADCDLIILSETYDLYDIYNHIQNLFDTFSKFEVDLLKISNSSYYQDIIDLGFQFIKNPIFLMESGHRVIALSPDIDIPSDPEWDFIRKNRFTPYESIKKMKKTGYLNTFKTTKTTTLFSFSNFPFQLIMSNISVNSRFTARLALIGSLKLFSKSDFLASKILTEIIELKMNKDEAYKYLRVERPLYSMLHDLIYGEKIDNEIIRNNLRQNLPNWLKGMFRVLFVPLDKIDEPTYDYYARNIEKYVDGCSILFKKSLIVILHFTRETDFVSLNKVITAFLSDNALVGSMSNEFGNLCELHEFYNQAVITFNFVKVTKKRMYFYSDYMLKHVLSFYPPQNVSSLCHPFVVYLKQHDHENGAQFFETFRVFLENERSLVKTAKALFIHRNTLLNRIDKIKDLLSVDLDNADTRLHILLSYKLLSTFK